MSDNNNHLNNILAAEKLKEGDSELEVLRERRKEVEAVLRDQFGHKPKIKYAGSKAKGTMIRTSYDLDIVCYFASGDTSAGESLKDIYHALKTTLAKSFTVVEKKSAIRVTEKNGGEDFHIDVVPGRFTDDTETDAYLYQASGDKSRLKTNIDTHIKHVKDSGQADVVSLLKLWSVTFELKTKTFVLELAAIDALKNSQSKNLTERFEAVLVVFRDSIEDLTVEDPANPQGNDLSELWSVGIQKQLSDTAKHTLVTVEDGGWESIFELAKDDVSDERVIDIVNKVEKPSRPWAISR